MKKLYLTSINKKGFAFGLSFFFLVLMPGFVLGQTTLYTQNFGTGTTLPTGWSSSGTPAWTNSVNTSSNGYVGASGGSNTLHTNTSGTATLTFSNNLSTVGYTNITVIWGANRTGNNTTTFQYSTNGTNWNNVTFTEVTNNTTWMLVNGGTRISLPSGASETANLRFRWTHTGDNSPVNYIRIDDFSVQGTPSCPTITASVTGQSNVSCYAGADGTITVSASGGVAPYTFSKDNGATYVTGNTSTSHTFNNLSANVAYKIRVKDNNGCESAIIP